MQKPNYLVTILTLAFSNYRANNGIEPRAVATSGQNSDSHDHSILNQLKI
jgi:hypothetical protein